MTNYTNINIETLELTDEQLDVVVGGAHRGFSVEATDAPGGDDLGPRPPRGGGGGR